MSYFFLDGYEDMEVYSPGEQPHDRPYIKLNANESSYPPSPAILAALSQVQINSMSHYEDPYNKQLRKAIGDHYGFSPEQVFVGNGADEVIGFIMMSFFREGFNIASTDVTYDFYRTYAKTFHLNYIQIPLKEDFSVDVDKFVDVDSDVILANPNNPIGKALPVSEIERIVAKDKKRLVIIDEAYIDYGADSCLPLVDKYANLIVVQTFSKSRNMPGARIGFGIANKELIDEMRKVKFCVSPFNLNTLSQTIGIAAVNDTAYLKECTERTISIRRWMQDELMKDGYFVIPTLTNFVFFRVDNMPASLLASKLKENGILIRHYDDERIKDYLRITIGTRAEMELVMKYIREITEDYKKKSNEFTFDENREEELIAS